MTAVEHGQAPSDEADRNQLKMAREEGEAYQRWPDYMVRRVADSSARKETGDYRRHMAAGSEQVLDFLDRGLVDRLIEDDLATRHGDNAVAGLEDVVHVVADEDAGDVLLAEAADEAWRGDGDALPLTA